MTDIMLPFQTNVGCALGSDEHNDDNSRLVTSRYPPSELEQLMVELGLINTKPGTSVLRVLRYDVEPCVEFKGTRDLLNNDGSYQTGWSLTTHNLLSDLYWLGFSGIKAQIDDCIAQRVPIQIDPTIESDTLAELEQHRNEILFVRRSGKHIYVSKQGLMDSMVLGFNLVKGARIAFRHNPPNARYRIFIENQPLPQADDSTVTPCGPYGTYRTTDIAGVKQDLHIFLDR